MANAAPTALLLSKEMKVQVRKERIEKIVRDIDCDLYGNITLLIKEIVKRYNAKYTQDLDGEKPLNTSTLLRKNSHYRTMIESFYKTEQRVRVKIRSKEAQLLEENLILKADLSSARSELANIRAAHQQLLTDTQRLRLNDISSRTDKITEKYSKEEIAAYMAILRIFQAGKDSSAFKLTDTAFVHEDFEGEVPVFGADTCPRFFAWYQDSRGDW